MDGTPKRILITGGAGFVGSSLALRLGSAYPDAAILCLDSLHRKGSELNRARVELAGVKYVRGDVRDRAVFEMPPCDLIVDAAAEPSVLAGRDGDAAFVVDTNLGGTLNVLEAARRWGAAVLFLSTSRVYPVEALRSIRTEQHEGRFEIAEDQVLPGISERGVSEDFPLQGARTLYGATKYASEIMAAEYAAQFGLPILIDRCGVLAGPWQMGRVDQGIVALWVAAHYFRRPLKYIGYEGKQVRDILHVEDLCDLVLRQLDAGLHGWHGEVCNIGGGRAVSVSLRELTDQCAQATGNTCATSVESEVRPGDVPLYITDAGRAYERWRWQPVRRVEDIVADTVRWIRDNEDVLGAVLNPAGSGQPQR